MAMEAVDGLFKRARDQQQYHSMAAAVSCLQAAMRAGSARLRHSQSVRAIVHMSRAIRAGLAYPKLLAVIQSKTAVDLHLLAVVMGSSSASDDVHKPVARSVKSAHARDLYVAFVKLRLYRQDYVQRKLSRCHDCMLTANHPFFVQSLCSEPVSVT